MASTLLKMAFISRGQTSINGILNSTRESLNQEIKSHTSAADLVSFQNFLTEYYYPEDKTSINPNSAVEEYLSILSEEASKEIIDVVSKYNFKALGQSPYKHKEGSSKETVTSYYNKLTMSLQLLETAIATIGPGGGKTKQKLNNVRNNIKNLLSTVYSFLNNKEYDSALTRKVGYNIIYDGEVGKQAAKLCRRMALYVSAINSGKNMDKKRVGDAFEKSLDEAVSSFYDQNLGNFIRSEVTGRSSIKRGVWDGKVLGGVSYEIIAQGLDKEALKKGGFETQVGNITFKYYPGADKQGKMDVYGEYTAAPLRISAKSWTKGSSNQVAETYIARGITRAVGPTIMEYYSLAMLNSEMDYLGNEHPKWISAKAGHDLAKVALTSDLVMGLNQRMVKDDPTSIGGQAEVLVIDTGSSIIVKDISSLVLDISKLRGYYEKNLENIAANIYKQMKKVKSPGRTNTYLGLYISTLDKIKVSYNLNRSDLGLD